MTGVEGSTARLIHAGWTERKDHGKVASLHYPDGQIRIEHACRTVDGLLLITAPALQLDNGHRVTQTEPLTVRPSIACGDCGLHGYIIDGSWQDC